MLRSSDPMALHYRHLSAQIARQLLAGRSVPEILLDRARGHVVSIKDPVTGGWVGWVLRKGAGQGQGKGKSRTTEEIGRDGKGTARQSIFPFYFPFFSFSICSLSPPFSSVVRV